MRRRIIPTIANRRVLDKSQIADSIPYYQTMPTIFEEIRYKELDELDEIEGQFLAFVLPWLKLVPKTTENDVPSYKVRVGGGQVTLEVVMGPNLSPAGRDSTFRDGPGLQGLGSTRLGLDL